MSDRACRPSVSVVIPCFNQGRFLSGAVDSVRAQRYEAVDCIVVNDGSTDQTAELAATLGVRVVEQPNRGVSHARNAGLAQTRSEYVVFLDADDELLPGAIAAGIEAFTKDRHAAAVVGQCQSMDVAGHSLPTLHTPVDPSNLYVEWLAKNFVWTLGAAMFRTDALQSIGGFPPDVGPAADYAVYLRLARFGRVRFLPIELARYRQHEMSMSRDPALMLRATLAVLKQESLETPTARRDIRQGRRTWCDWYGEQIVDRLRAHWRANRRGRAQVGSMLTLLRYCPRVAARHLARKARLVVTASANQAVTPVLRVMSGGRRSASR